MGTYTTNYNLFMPTVGETGWGELVNGNFSTIDTTMKSLNNRITAVENEVNGALSCTSITTSGKVTGNGGIAGTTGTFSGEVTAASFNGRIRGLRVYAGGKSPLGFVCSSTSSQKSLIVVLFLGTNVTYNNTKVFLRYSAVGTNNVYVSEIINNGGGLTLNVPSGITVTYNSTSYTGGTNTVISQDVANGILSDGCIVNGTTSSSMTADATLGIAINTSNASVWYAPY